jgi:hypothetical protein
VALVRERTILIERLSLVGKVSAFFAERGCRVVSAADTYGRILEFLDRRYWAFIKIKTVFIQRQLITM